MSEERMPLVRKDPGVAELNRVPGFDPVKLLLQILTEQNLKEPARTQMVLKIKKLWFRRTYPHGRIRVTAQEVTKQSARIQAEIYLDRADSAPVSNFIGSRNAENTPSGLFVQAAEFEAIDNALTDAGFGIQLCDVAKTFGEEAYTRSAAVSGSGVVDTPVTVGSTSPEHGSTTVTDAREDPASDQRRQARDQEQTGGTPAGAPPVESVSNTQGNNGPAPESCVETGNVKEKDSAGESSGDKRDFVQPMESGNKPGDGAPSDAGEDQKPPAEGRGETDKINPSLRQETPMTVQGEGQREPGGAAGFSASWENETTAGVTRTDAPAAGRTGPQETPGDQGQTIQKAAEETAEGELTIEQALQMVADVGSFRGKTLAEIADKRPTTLRWFFTTCPNSSEQLKKAAKLVFENLNQQKVA